MIRLLKYTSMLLLFAFTSAALAVAPTSLEKKELVLLVDRLNTAIHTENYDAIVQNIPKRLSYEMAVRLRVSEETLRKSQKEHLQKQFDTLGKDAFKMDSANIQYLETSKGVMYALVPVRIETADAVVDEMMLFLHDDNGWHIIFGGKKIVQNPVFQEIYPAFENVMLPMGKITYKNKPAQEKTTEKQ